MKARNIKRKAQNKGIVSLITVMVIGVFALGTALAIASDVLLESVKNKNTVSGDQVFYTAEAHNAEGAHQYIVSYDKTKDCADQPYSGGPPSTNPNGTVSGNIFVECLTWPYVKIKGISDNASTHRVSFKIITAYSEGEAFDSAVYAQDDLNIGGSVDISGNIFANGDVNFIGNSAEVNGDVYAAGEIDGNGENYGNGFTGVEPIAPPEIDTAPYLIEATANGTFYSLASAAESAVKNNTTNGVVYVEDAGGAGTKIEGTNTVINGALVVVGNLDLKGGTFNAGENYAAVVVAGNLKVTGSVVINGIVYVKGDTTFSAGNPVINGSLISANGVNTTDITGNVTINYDDENIPEDLRDLVGLETESVSDPVAIYWSEE